MKRVALLCIVLGALLAGAVGVVVWAWRMIGDVDIGTAGLLAMAGGAIGSLALGIGLMRLAYRSERRDVE